jgi:hypothetical protein
LEAFVITHQKKHNDRYKALGKKFKQLQDNTDTEVQENLTKGLKDVSSTRYLPEDLASYILSLKHNLNMAVSILPESLFKRPVFLGKEDFYFRLASELISFGLAFQRVYLQPIKLSKLAELFHQHRSWWKCDIQDIEKALVPLTENNIIEYSTDGYMFEPLTLSREVHDFLALIAKGINKNGEISLSKVYDLVSWKRSKIDSILSLLLKNKICLSDQSNKTLYFPELNIRI